MKSEAVFFQKQLLSFGIVLEAPLVQFWKFTLDPVFAFDFLLLEMREIKSCFTYVLRKVQREDMFYTCFNQTTYDFFHST